MTKVYPIALRVERKKCVVVGGGAVAHRKAVALRRAGADVVVVSPGLCEKFRRTRNLTIRKRKYRPSDLKGALLAIAATDDVETNRRVSRDGGALGVLVNVVDDPAASGFLVPASVSRGPLLITVSTSGASPAFSARIRRELERLYPAEYGKFVKLLASLRNTIKAHVSDSAARKRVFEELCAEKMFRTFRKEGPRSVRAELRRLLNR